MNQKLYKVLASKYLESPEEFERTVERIVEECDERVITSTQKKNDDSDEEICNVKSVFQDNDPPSNIDMQSIPDKDITPREFEDILRQWYIHGIEELLDTIRIVRETGQKKVSDSNSDNNLMFKDGNPEPEANNELKDGNEVAIPEPLPSNFSASLAQSFITKFPYLAYGWEKHIFTQLGEGGDVTDRGIQFILQEVQKSAAGRYAYYTDIVAVFNDLRGSTILATTSSMAPYRNVLFSRFVSALILRSRVQVQTLMPYAGDGVRDIEENCQAHDADLLRRDLQTARINVDEHFDVVTLCFQRSMTSFYDCTDLEQSLMDMERLLDEIRRCKPGASIYACKLSLSTRFQIYVLQAYRKMFKQIFLINMSFSNSMGVLFYEKKELWATDRLLFAEERRLRESRRNIDGGPRTMLSVASPEDFLAMKVIEKLINYNNAVYNEETNRMLAFLTAKFM